MTKINLTDLKNYFDSLKKKIEEDKDNINLLKSLKKSLFLKDSILSQSLNQLKKFQDIGEKRKYGTYINSEKNDILKKIQEKIAFSEKKISEDGLSSKDKIFRIQDNSFGEAHPINKVLYSLVFYHIKRDFFPYIADEIVKTEDNFDFLNFNTSHVARLTNNTFYIDNFSNAYILNTHTTSFQSKLLTDFKKPPIKAINYGKTYRNDETDSTHLPFFHQFDCVYINSDASVLLLKNHMKRLADFIFKDMNLKYRFRRTYFPFTEPSFEIDIECKHGEINYCVVCKNEGWIEWCGLGMINSSIFKRATGFPSGVKGYAFGIGVERTLMIIEKLKDIRELISK